MATISMEQVKTIVGGLYLENIALQAEVAVLKAAAPPILEPLPDDVNAINKRPPSLHAVDNVG